MYGYPQPIYEPVAQPYQEYLLTNTNNSNSSSGSSRSANTNTATLQKVVSANSNSSSSSSSLKPPTASYVNNQRVVGGQESHMKPAGSGNSSNSSYARNGGGRYGGSYGNRGRVNGEFVSSELASNGGEEADGLN